MKIHTSRNHSPVRSKNGQHQLHTTRLGNYGFPGHRSSEQEKTLVITGSLVLSLCKWRHWIEEAWRNPRTVARQADKDDTLRKDADIKPTVWKPQAHSVTTGWPGPAWLLRFTIILPTTIIRGLQLNIIAVIGYFSRQPNTGAPMFMASLVTMTNPDIYHLMMDKQDMARPRDAYHLATKRNEVLAPAALWMNYTECRKSDTKGHACVIPFTLYSQKRWIFRDRR